MSFYVTISKVVFPFGHMSPEKFRALAAKVRAIPDIDDQDNDTSYLDIDPNNQTIWFHGTFRGGGEQILMPYFMLIAKHLKKIRPEEGRGEHYVDTYGDSAERSFLQVDNEHIRYVIAPGRISEQRMFVSQPYEEYLLMPRPELPDNVADIEGCMQGLRDKLEILEIKRDGLNRRKAMRTDRTAAGAKTTRATKA